MRRMFRRTQTLIIPVLLSLLLEEWICVSQKLAVYKMIEIQERNMEAATDHSANGCHVDSVL